MTRILVAGATGHVGAPLVSSLLARGHAVRALVRDPARAARLPREAERALGDVLDPVSLERAMQGVDVVVSTVSGYRAGGFPRPDAERIEREGHTNLLAAARAARVRRVVYVSVLAADRAKDVPHFAVKADVEAMIRKSGLEWVVLRPGAFLDQEDDRFGRGLSRGVVEAMGDAERAWSHVPVEHLATVLARAVDHPDASGRVIDVASDRPLSARELASISSRALGRPVRVRALPWAVAGTVMALIGLFVPGVRNLRAMLRFLVRGEYVADLRAHRELFGEPPASDAMIERFARRTESLPAGEQARSA